MILDEECAAIAETVRARAWERLAPHAAEIDRTQAFSKPVWEELRSMGIFGLPFAPEAGGAGASTLAYIVALEQVAYSCAVAALYPGTTVQVAQALLAHAPEPVAARWVPRLVAGEVPAAWAFTEPQTGSDPRQLTTRARRDGNGWILDGQKMFISYAAEAAVALVFAVTEEQQVCAFVIDTAQPGWTTGPAAEVMAFGGTGARPVYLESVCAGADDVIGGVGDGFDVMLAGEAVGKLRVSAINVGVAQRALHEATAYALRRTHRGAAIATKFVGIQSLLADMRAAVLAARALLYETARLHDDGADIGARAAALRLVTGRPPGRSPVTRCRFAAEAIVMAGQLTKPALGAINGPVMTGGLELALGLDLLIASERARFADTHAAVGILPGGGMTARLPRAVGARMAMEMSYTGRMIDAAEAERIGLVNHVVAHEDLLPATLAMAATIASRDPAVLRQLKKLYQVSTTVTMGAAMAHELRERDRRRAAGQALTPR